MKNILLFFLVFLFLLLSYVYVVKQGSGYDLTVSSHALNTATKKELTSEDYKYYLQNILEISKNQDPKKALQELEILIKEKSEVSAKCHNIAHEVGHLAYHQYGDFSTAIKYDYGICNSGYLHGLIESYFYSSQDIATLLEGVCDSQPAEKYTSWQCYHGIGHGLMQYFKRDIEKSISLCEGFYDTFAVNSCINGVFMELFNVDMSIDERQESDIDPFELCSTQSESNKNVCYLYAPTYYLSYNLGRYKEAFEWCRALSEQKKLICLQGVGSQTMKENLEYPKFVEKICMSGDKSESQNCISGMTAYIISHNGSIENAEKLCKQLSGTNAKVCRSVIENYSSMFE